uniref:pilus assembly FimT family protein n=1 Tax=Psychrobacter sp. TaxID=56811 RepID=UPI00159A1952|nr:prepilin-type N-terminal cleavage/methylation domain-containing protein [Psychrobacter sp.]QJS05949.1 pre-pilin like leader sequence [Psychrobacter sp.]
MVRFGSNENGVSLIELMITITILSILVLAGTSLTGLWSKQAELDKATISLKSGVSLARSIAIRNEFPHQTAYMASQICFNRINNELSVHKATATESASCSTPVAFKYPLSQTIEIKNNNIDFLCFSFNHLGQVSNDIGSCETNLSLTISNGSLNETLNLN